MFADYATSIILILFCFRVLLGLLVLPFALIFALVNRNQDERESDKWPPTINQTIVSVLLSGMIAIVTRAFAYQPAVVHRWLYWTSGALCVLFVLGGNAADKAKLCREEFSFVSEGAELGAGIGFCLGLLTFPIMAWYPFLLTAIPGAQPFLGMVLSLAAWLNGFWFVQVILYLTVGSYVLNFAFLALVMIAMAIYAGYSALFGRKPAAQARSAGA